MDDKLVKDLMVPLNEYAIVSEDASLLDAYTALENAQKNIQPGRQPYRAVIVISKNKKVLGKIGHLTFLKALEPKYSSLGDTSLLYKAGVDSELIESMVQNLQFFQDNLLDAIKRMCLLNVKEVMRPVEESIDENANLKEAIHRIVMLQTLSIFVTKNNEVVGLLRLSDLFDEVSRKIKTLNDI